MKEKPDYIRNFIAPKYTEIKHIGKYYYLYERYSVYDKETGKTRKKSGPCIGRITEDGSVIPSRHRKNVKNTSNQFDIKQKVDLSKIKFNNDEIITADASCSASLKNEMTNAENGNGEIDSSVKPSIPISCFATTNKKLAVHDCCRVGAEVYFYNNTGEMRDRLKKHFPDIWEEIYVMVFLRAFYSDRFKNYPFDYENSIFSCKYRHTRITEESITDLLKKIGFSRSSIAEYMLEMLTNEENIIIFDGHRILSSSKYVDDAEKIYDSKRRFKPQINLFYACTYECSRSGEESGLLTGHPAYYKKYVGSTPDIAAIEDIVQEIDLAASNITVVCDNESGNSRLFDYLDERKINCLVPLPRGNKYISGKVPNSPREYEETFTFQERAIQSITINGNDFNVFLYLDLELLEDEMYDIVYRVETNTDTEKLKSGEMARRAKAKNELTDEEFEKLSPYADCNHCSDQREIGTFSVKTNRLDLNSKQVYFLYKLRQNMESFFDVCSTVMEFDSSYLQDDIQKESWLFLNHLSASFARECMEHIESQGLSSEYSYNDFRTCLRRISAMFDGDNWIVAPIKERTATFLEKLNLSITDQAVGELLSAD